MQLDERCGEIPVVRQNLRADVFNWWFCFIRGESLVPCNAGSQEPKVDFVPPATRGICSTSENVTNQRWCAIFLFGTAQVDVKPTLTVDPQNGAPSGAKGTSRRSRDEFFR